MKKLCRNCFNFINIKKGDTECPICHKTLTNKKKQETEIKTTFTEDPKDEVVVDNVRLKTTEKVNDTVTEEQKDKYLQKNGRIKWVSRRVREGKVKAPKKVVNPRISGVHIDVESSSYFARSKNKYSPAKDKFVIEKDGKYQIHKLEWWEIYKWADRQLAKNKIRKIVKKESIKKPERVSFSVLLCLCLFSGFLGVHNFYAGNIKKGLVSAISFTLAIGYVMFLDGIKFFNLYFQGLLCALPGLICLAIWLTDLISIIFRKFKYRSSKLEYIKTLDLETRARLGKKYIYIV